jgi:AcrR family transcriptional regulator
MTTRPIPKARLTGKSARKASGKTPRNTLAKRAPEGGGYRKGDETRERILDAALQAFGEASFREATTRRIAQTAAVSLPTLQYYFGDKEGLYHACAEAIVERYLRHTAGASEAARQALESNCAAEAAREHLKKLIAALADVLVGEARAWIQFVSRELRDPGPAFDVLYESLWRPGLLLASLLVARILGLTEPDTTARIQALLLISCLASFQSGRAIALRALRWSAIGRKELALVLSVMNAQIDAIGRIQAQA